MSSPVLSRVAPMKAAVDDLPADDGNWLTELKWDGMRLMVHVADGEILMRSASGRLCTAAFPELATIAEVVPDGTVLDGEAVVMVDGSPSFRALQRRIHVTRPSPSLVEAAPVQLVIFDVLWFDGHDVRALPFETRRSALDRTIEATDRWSISLISDGPPRDLFDFAVERGLEGVVCKRRDSPYVSGRSAHWRKVKIRPRTDMVIGGWIPGSGALRNTIGSVVVGTSEGGGFRCAGAVGSGLTDDDRRRLLQAFTERSDSPFVNPEVITDREADPITWVEPLLVAEIGFARWDPGELLWQPTFHGLRPDGDPSGTEYRLPQ